MKNNVRGRNSHRYTFYGVRKLTSEQFITLPNLCHLSLDKTHGCNECDMLTDEKLYHMIFIIIIGVRGKTMLQRALGSGWGILLPVMMITGLAFTDLSLAAWKAMIVSGLLLTSLMLYHKQLRHFVLLPSCVALVSGIMLVVINANQG